MLNNYLAMYESQLIIAKYHLEIKKMVDNRVVG